MELYKISIVTVSYNQGQFIRDNIESVLSQNYDNFEHIIIDGGSTDNTVSILKEYPHLNWVSEKDKGQSDGLNKGFKKATGDIIAWINSDDMLCSNALNEVNNYFVKHKDRSVLVGNQVFIDGVNKTIKTVKAQVFSADWLINGVKSAVMQNSTFFLSDVFNKTGYLDESFHYTMDRDLFIRIAQNYQVYTIEKDLAYFRVWEDSKTYTSKISFFKDLIKVKRKYNAPYFSLSNIWIVWQFCKEPFRKIDFLRNFVQYMKK
ncbi:Glycosyltransferase, GT2 family [Flavobacterium gillisiae]|uniref:Glycosyltransferase, GT2 family n=1 Tax=Flavobacterium gillisiae TaxID=150146 RepID=A0A1H3ZRV9_9FLAO|nr:glycosyltransferase family 2 protein [Flavobacterium gillisiae]SEA26004.1 Glycosyltransferase, GT2 family [Flavobacterium gillisiae]